MRFLTEGRVLAKMQHRNIVEIFDFGRTAEGRLFYLMELLQGQDLQEVMNQRGAMSPGEVLPILEQICAGLQTAHDKGVVHRDLKPANILVLDEEPLAVKLLDFGLAKLLEDQDPEVKATATGMVVGTPLFIAPEQAAGERNRISPSTDLYSLGVILYWMLSGKPPFYSDAPGSLMLMHITAPPPPLQQAAPSVPAALAQLVEECLEKEPLDRPGSAREVAARFAAICRASARPEPLTTAPRAPGPDLGVSVTLPPLDLLPGDTLRDDRPAPALALQSLEAGTTVLPLPGSLSATEPGKLAEPRGRATRPWPPAQEPAADLASTLERPRPNAVSLPEAMLRVQNLKLLTSTMRMAASEVIARVDTAKLPQVTGKTRVRSWRLAGVAAGIAILAAGSSVLWWSARSPSQDRSSVPGAAVSATRPPAPSPEEAQAPAPLPRIALETPSTLPSMETSEPRLGLETPGKSIDRQTARSAVHRRPLKRKRTEKLYSSPEKAQASGTPVKPVVQNGAPAKKEKTEPPLKAKSKHPSIGDGTMDAFKQ